MRGGRSCRGAQGVNEFFQANRWYPDRVWGVWARHGARVVCSVARLGGHSLLRVQNVGLFKKELAGFPLNKPSKMKNHLWD